MPEQNMKFETVPIVMELIPAVIQAGGIAVFLTIVRDESFFTLTAIVLSLVWLKISMDNKTIQEYGEIRAMRSLFSQLGEWIGHSNSAEAFDEAYARYLMIDGSIEDDVYRVAMTATGISNGFKSLVSIAVHLYLMFVIYENSIELFK